MRLGFPPSKQFCFAKVSDMKSRGVTCIFVARAKVEGVGVGEDGTLMVKNFWL